MEKEAVSFRLQLCLKEFYYYRGYLLLFFSLVKPVLPIYLAYVLRKRIIYAAFIIIIIAFGISTRKVSGLYPVFVSENFGDVLWAAMVYFACRFIFYNKPIFLSVLLSLSFSFLIEVSQLYQASWINNLRMTTLGALILGHGFLVIDFIRYTAGIIFSAVLDLMFSRKQGELKV